MGCSPWIFGTENFFLTIFFPAITIIRRPFKPLLMADLHLICPPLQHLSANYRKKIRSLKTKIHQRAPNSPLYRCLSSVKQCPSSQAPVQVVITARVPVDRDWWRRYTGDLNCSGRDRLLCQVRPLDHLTDHCLLLIADTRVFPPISDLKHVGITIQSLDVLRGPTAPGVPVRASIVASASQSKNVTLGRHQRRVMDVESFYSMYGGNLSESFHLWTSGVKYYSFIFHFSRRLSGIFTSDIWNPGYPFDHTFSSYNHHAGLQAPHQGWFSPDLSISATSSCQLKKENQKFRIME